MALESSGDICTLPEDCIAAVLSLTSPKDACRLSAVASTFRSASQSDVVWNRFLPSDYRDIISRAVDGDDSLLARFHSKKDLYLYLCDNPILIDEGRKSFSLEKSSGKKCYMLAARDLTIVSEDTPRYWQWINLPESRFPEVAELLDVCWFIIRGRLNVNVLSPGTNYAAYLIFTCKSTPNGFEHQSSKAYVGVPGRQCKKRIVCLDPQGEQGQRYQIVQQENATMDPNTEYPKQRKDKWMEVELREYFVKGGEDGDFEVMEVELGEYFVKGGEDRDFQVSLMHLSSGWKNGLIIQGIEIRPKECK